MMRWIVIMIAMWSRETLASQGVGLNLGFATGTIEQDQTKEEYDATGKLTRSLTYSGLKVDLGYQLDLSRTFAISGGLGFVTALQALNSATSLKNGVFVAPTFYILGGPRRFAMGKEQLVVEESRASRLSVPIYIRYETIDFESSLVGKSDNDVQQVFHASHVAAELDLHYEYDLLSQWNLGAGFGYRLFGIPMSKSKVTDKYLTLYLSLERYLD